MGKSDQRGITGALCADSVPCTHRKVPGVEVSLIIMTFRATRGVHFKFLRCRPGRMGPERRRDLPKA